MRGRRCRTQLAPLHATSCISADALSALAEPAWRERQVAHERRVRTWTDPHQHRAERGEKHPVYDFLFTYYSFRPAWLRRWHPGPGLVLTGEAAREFLRWPEYHELPPTPEDPAGPRFALDTSRLAPSRQPYVRWLHGRLRAMQDRPAFFGCHGLHEWAMVYRQTDDEVRYRAWPLRFSASELAQIVEAGTVCCSHFDAFRFFTPAARPLNRLQPTRADVPPFEQRGCLHANMDLYKWAFKLSPFVPSEFIADCFELALAIREIDMRASPYDLRAIGFEPIPVETGAGRAEYETHQRTFTARGEPLRARLIALCEHLLAP